MIRKLRSVETVAVAENFNQYVRVRKCLESTRTCRYMLNE